MRMMLPKLTPSNVVSRTSAPITVCFVIDELNQAGTETQLLALIRGLDRSRIRPVLCLLKRMDETFRAMIPDDCPMIVLGVNRLMGRQAFSAALDLRRFWKTHRVQIVQTYFLDSTYFAVPLARLSGIRRVVRVRNNVGYWMTRKHRWLGRLVGKACARTLTNSSEGREAIIQSEHLAERNVSVITNGVDLDRFPVRRWPELNQPAVKFGMVGNLRPVKNVDGLIRVMARVMKDHPKITLEVAGEGDQRASLERLIAENNLQGRVILRGSLRDIPAFLESLDVTVLPSHSESLSNAVLEYMAAGRAIIATNVGANATLLRNEVDGLIIPAGVEPALESAVRRMLQEPNLGRAISRSARRRVEENYSRERMLEEFHRFYESLFDGGGTADG
ncbi:glycosyltransferase [Zavarzinella formosa]|uniref:glycosyltransferase n=1 Tax=Zavarzinella formosa TaxID=360055 RepID=UPI0002FA29F2|nr:glycosyltransferase [Zavarzinella formosa]